MIPISRRELESYTCRTCQAKPGEPCMTLTRNPELRRPTQPHQDRWDQVRAARMEVRTALKELGPPGVRPLTWHTGTHPSKEHDGYRRHMHSLNGTLTIDPQDPSPHFSWGPPFSDEALATPPEQRTVHFLYDTRRDPGQGTPNLWCSCHLKFGADAAAARQHIQDTRGVPGWIAGLVRELDHALDALVIQGMIERDEDVSDRELYVRYRNFLRDAMSETWANAR